MTDEITPTLIRFVSEATHFVHEPVETNCTHESGPSRSHQRARDARYWKVNPPFQTCCWFGRRRKEAAYCGWEWIPARLCRGICHIQEFVARVDAHLRDALEPHERGRRKSHHMLQYLVVQIGITLNFLETMTPILCKQTKQPECATKEFMIVWL